MVMAEDPTLEELKEALRAGGLVLVVGEGISEAAGVGGRRRLVALLVEHARAGGVAEPTLAEVEALASRDRLIDALSALEAALGANEFGVAMEGHLNDRDLVLPEVIGAIGAIAPGIRAILTTNVDQLIERATGSQIPSLTKATGDLAQRRSGFILKLHGTLIDRSTWVFTRQQHDAVYADQAFKQVFSALFLSSTMLFVGCELTEDVFEELLRQARALLADQPPRHFALMVEDPGKAHQRRMLAKAGVKVISYENRDGKHDEVARILRKLAAAALDLKRFWPNAIAVTTPPPLESHHVRRSDIIARIVQMNRSKAIEIVGISGSGKTSLATETVEHLQLSDPDRAVYYVEVRNEDRLRNVLVGVTFELHRTGFGAAFGLAIRSDVAEEQVIRDVARALGACERSILLVVDLVEGTCNPGFARHLAAFVRSIASPRTCIAIFGQEQALRDLTPLERKEIGVEHLDVRGFHFQEFVRLVSHFHTSTDRTALHDIYHRITAGRSGYLSASLAHALARAESLEKMAEISASPADTMLSRAEQERFGRVSPAALPAAERLVCFLLPFRQDDAQAIFPDENIALAVRELRTLGLLRQRDAERFEMLETVRAGLELLLGTGTRRRAHEAIATWCRERGLLTAEILHLGKAGKQDDAHKRARDAFLTGEHWEALAEYVTEHHVISAPEVIGLLVRDTLPNNAYLLPGILRKLGNASAAEDLLRQVRQQQERFDKDYQWAWKMVEAILYCDGTKLYDLLQFALESDLKHGDRHTRLGWIRTGARRAEVRIDSRIIELFGHQPPAKRLHMLPTLLFDRRREILKEAFQFLVSYEEPIDWRRLGEFVTPEIPLLMEEPTDVVEFLASLPEVEPSAMIVARSALLGPFSGFVWSQRRILREQCIKLLQASAEEESILESAIRVLLFLAEPSLLALCEPLLVRKSRLGTFAKLIPAFVPTLIDKQTYEKKLLDPNRDINERIGDITVLAAAGADVGKLLSRLRESDPDSKRVEFFEFLALMECAVNPFEEAIPLLEEQLSRADSEKAQLFVPLVMKLGTLPLSSSLNMLLRVISHPEPRIRLCGAITLCTRRSRRALPRLLECCAEEMDDGVAQSMAVAAIASGPRSSSGFETLWTTLPNGSLWRCILATRLRDASASEHLIACATDPTNHWQLRRAAILAAGRLPYEAALERIAPVVLQERSPFHIDQDYRLLAHSVISVLTLEEAPGMFKRFVAGKERFVKLFGDIFEDCWRESDSRNDGVPTGKDAASWLFTRLLHHGWPHNNNAPDLVIWELNIPILHAAVLRALRLCGKTELIEEQISIAYHPWLLMKCIKERTAVEILEPAVVDRLEALAAASPWNGSPFVANIFRSIRFRLPVRKAWAEETLPMAQQSPNVVGTSVQYPDVVRALTDENFHFDPKPPLVLTDLATDEQKHLALLLDTSMDYTYVPQLPSEPKLQFLRGGYTIGSGHPSQIDNRSRLRAALRPAVAAANRFQSAIPWHRELLHDAGYVQSFIDCLAAQNDIDRFYDELNEHADLLIPVLSDISRLNPVLKFMDARMVPFLERYSGSGTDAFFEVLCAMARRIEGPEIDPVLAALLYRWVQRFDHRAKKVQHRDNAPLWRGLDHLSLHPRFVLIPGYESQLSIVMNTPNDWWRKNQIVRILEKSPRAYAEIECLLMKTASFEHHFEDEVDRLDDAADRLFHQLLDNNSEHDDKDTRGGSTICAPSQMMAVVSSGCDEPQSMQENIEVGESKTTVFDILDGWGLLKEDVNLRGYSMKNWRALSHAVERIYGPLPEPARGSVHFGLFESTALLERRLPAATLVNPLLVYERVWLPDPVFSFFSHEASEAWRCLPESGSTYFTGRKSIRTSWNTLWTAPADTRKALILEHLPKLLDGLRQLRPLIEVGAVGLVPWESVFFPRRAEFKSVVSELRDAKPVVDATTKLDQDAYNLGHRLGAIGISLSEDQPNFKLKKGDKLHFEDKTHVILLGLLHARICSALGASFLPNLEGDRAVYDVLKGIGRRSSLAPQAISLPNLENAQWDEIIAIRRDSATLAEIRCVLKDASTIVDASGISVIQSRLEESTCKLKEDFSLWKQAGWTTTDATVLVAIGADSGLASGSHLSGISAGTLAQTAALISSAARSDKDAEQRGAVPISEILVRFTSKP
ncbi:SIR2 family protein [Sorangium sp. So ce295]|uniref:SIR2 family protein n=1 Tax=Sorangium sp. So ce295 TaxID=3133295 RepID=UPI003F62A9E3